MTPFSPFEGHVLCPEHCWDHKRALKLLLVTGGACRSKGLQLFDAIERKQEAEALELIGKERTSAYVQDANKHGYALHHAVFQVPSSFLAAFSQHTYVHLSYRDPLQPL